MDEQSKKSLRKEGQAGISLEEISNLFERNRKLETELKMAQGQERYWRERYWSYRNTVQKDIQKNVQKDIPKDVPKDGKQAWTAVFVVAVVIEAFRLGYLMQ